MNNLIVFDAHCDVITRIMGTSESLYDNKSHMDIKRALKYKGYIQFFSVWVSPDFTKMTSLKKCLQIIDSFYCELEKNKSYISLATNYDEALKIISQGKIAAFLSLEGGDPIQGDLSILRILYKLGIRSICLTWNGRNEIADGIEEECTGGGLTRFGRQLVREMNKMGILIDVSHLSTKGFWDVLEESKYPVIASHSNSKAICSHKRNITDEQFKSIIAKQGVVGINFCPEFLKDGGNACLYDIIKHIEHFMSLGGEDSVGIGSDYDGIDKTPEGINGVQDTEKVINELIKLNYSSELIEKISYKNFMRVIGNTIY